jgi:hypothetical protein
MMTLIPKWIRVIQENNRKRREVFYRCQENYALLEPVALKLAEWPKLTLDDLQASIVAMRASYLLLLADKMCYLATLHFMGVWENLFYTPEVSRQQRTLDGLEKALDDMIKSTINTTAFLKKYRGTGILPSAFEGQA